MGAKDSLYSVVEKGSPAHTACVVAYLYGQVDGEHHKQWVIYQMIRALTGENYDEFVKIAKNGEDGPGTYGYDEGIAP